MTDLLRVGIVRARTLSWRATAIYFWITALAAISGVSQTLFKVENLALDQTLEALDAIGFEPANERYLEAVLKVSWVLIIVNFRLRTLLLLAVYTASFPIWILAIYLFKRLSTARGISPQGAYITSRDESRPFPLTAAFIALLVGWFLLYGGSSEWPQVIPGIILSGLLLIALSLRLFSRVRPVRMNRAGAFSWLIGPAEHFPTQYPVVPNKSYTSVDEIETEVVILRFFRRKAIQITAMLGHPRASDVTSFLVFADYIVSLVVVTGVAVFFWALIIVVVTATTMPMTLITASQASLAQLIPGIGGKELEATIPYWVEVGPALTGWVLFVLYIGPAASMLRERQEVANAERATARQRLRDVSLELSQGVRYRAHLADCRREQQT